METLNPISEFVSKISNCRKNNLTPNEKLKFFASYRLPIIRMKNVILRLNIWQYDLNKILKILKTTTLLEYMYKIIEMQIMFLKTFIFEAINFVSSYTRTYYMK